MHKLDTAAIRRNSIFVTGGGATEQKEKEEYDRERAENNFIYIFKLLDRANHGRLRMPEISCLGEAMIGHPPEEKDMKKQVHHARSRVLVEKIVTKCTEFCGGSLWRTADKNTKQNLVANFMATRMREYLHQELDDLFLDPDVVKLKETAHTNMCTKLQKIFERGKKGKTFSRARSNLPLRLDITLELAEILMTEEVLLMVEKTFSRYYTLKRQEFINFSFLTFDSLTSEQLDDFCTELMERICKLQCRLTNEQRGHVLTERRGRLKEMNDQIKHELKTIRNSAGKLNAAEAERRELERRLEPKEHDWWYIRGQWKEVVLHDGKYEEVFKD